MVYYQYSFESIFRSIEIRKWKIQIYSLSFYFAYIKQLSDAKTKQLFDVNGKFGSINIIMKDRIYDESQLHVMFYSPELHLHVKETTAIVV